MLRCTEVSQPMSLVGQNQNASRMLACQLWPAADKPPQALYSAMCRYCCKSPKLPGANFLAVKKSDRRPPIDVAPITLPRSPAIYLQAMRSPTSLHESRVYSQKNF